MITNKFLTMNNCKKCDKEGIVSQCCDYEIKFISNGAAKCNKCKKFCRINYCSECKEDNSEYIIPNHPQSTSEEYGKHKSISKPNINKQTYKAIIRISIPIILFISLYIILYIISYL